MVLKDQIKNYANKLVEDRPSADMLRASVRDRKFLAIAFDDDGIVPNNPKLPLIVYRRAVAFPKNVDPATVIDAIFESNGWARSWRDSVYDFVHYHSQIHEVLGVARGEARVEFGGIKGRVLSLVAGDVVVLPAGTGHRLIEASRNFLVVGAYPADGTYDECTDTRERLDAKTRIAKVKKPAQDPLYGKRGAVARSWAAT